MNFKRKNDFVLRGKIEHIINMQGNKFKGYEGLKKFNNLINEICKNLKGFSKIISELS